MQHSEDSIVAHLDLLGFSSMLTANTDLKACAEALHAALERAIDWIGGRESLRGTPEAEWSVRAFSDCLCVAKPMTDFGLFTTFAALCNFQQEMLRSGLALRGGLACGEHSESDLMVFSRAQLEAYQLEANVALYPRIVVSERIVERVDSIEDDELRKDAKELLIRDPDGHVFLNYLVFDEEEAWQIGEEFYRVQKTLITERLRENVSSPTVRAKWEWVAALHNWSLWNTGRVLEACGYLEDEILDFTQVIAPGERRLREFRSLLWSDRAFIMPVNFKSVVPGTPDREWMKHWPGYTIDDDLAGTEGPGSENYW